MSRVGLVRSLNLSFSSCSQVVGWACFVFSWHQLVVLLVDLAIGRDLGPLLRPLARLYLSKAFCSCHVQVMAGLNAERMPERNTYL